MGRRTVTQFANQIKRVLSPAVINDLGRDAGFCVRERLITPYRLVVSLLAGHAMGRVETLADIQRQFNALFATTVAYKPFHNQLAKRTFPDFMREVLSRILQQWVVEVLQPKAHAPLGEFGRILIQDGCSFAVKETLREQYPGRFNKQNPAAVELHVPAKPITESGAKPITQSGQADHLSERSDAGVRLCRSVIGLGQWSFLLSHGASFEFELVGVVNETVEDRVGEGGVAERIVPVLDGELTGDQGGPGSVAVLEEFEEVAAVVGVELGESEVIKHDEVELGERGEQFRISAVAAGDGDVVQQPR